MIFFKKVSAPKLVDETLGVFSDVFDDCGYQINDIRLATLDPKAGGVLGYYDGSNIAINQSYFNANMETAPAFGLF